MTRPLLSTILLSTALAFSQPAGRWDGTITINTLSIPLRLNFTGDATTLTGAFINGKSTVASSSGRFADNTIHLAFDKLGTTLDARLVDGALKGTNGSATLGTHNLTANAFCSCGFEGEAGPAVMGMWEIPAAGWRLTLERDGEDTFATITKPQGSIGPLAGRFDGASFSLHYFDGQRAAILEFDEPKDGKLDLVWKEPGSPKVTHKAVRANTK